MAFATLIALVNNIGIEIIYLKILNFLFIFVFQIVLIGIMPVYWSCLGETFLYHMRIDRLTFKTLQGKSLRRLYSVLDFISLVIKSYQLNYKDARTLFDREALFCITHLPAIRTIILIFINEIFRCAKIIETFLERKHRICLFLILTFQFLRDVKRNAGEIFICARCF